MYWDPAGPTTDKISMHVKKELAWWSNRLDRDNPKLEKISKMPDCLQ